MELCVYWSIVCLVCCLCSPHSLNLFILLISSLLLVSSNLLSLSFHLSLLTHSTRYNTPSNARWQVTTFRWSTTNRERENGEWLGQAEEGRSGRIRGWAKQNENNFITLTNVNGKSKFENARVSTISEFEIVF